MNQKAATNTLTLSGWLTVIGMVLAAAGILTLFLTGWIDQSLPIGTIVLAAAAALVTVVRRRWALITTFALTLFIFIMGFIAPGLFDRLSHPGVISAFAGTWTQEIGLMIALAAGGIAIMENKGASR